MPGNEAGKSGPLRTSQPSTGAVEIANQSPPRIFRIIRSRTFGLLLLICVATLALMSGCTTNLVPPYRPPNPTAVLLSDYGKHSSLLFPDSVGGMEEYTFGDWDYFALGKKNPIVAIHALIHSPQSTLGRRWLAVSADASNANEMIGAQRTQRLIVDGDRVAALHRGLDLEYARHAGTELYNPAEHLYFVRCDEPYNLFHNCNNVTAQWLEKLGVEVHGLALTSAFKVEPASPPAQ